MGKLNSMLESPTTLLYLFLTSGQFANGIYLAGDVEPPATFTILYAAGFLWAVGWWLLKDGKRLSVGGVFDMGLFLYIAWPLLLPYYLLRTRGVKGWLAILVFVGVYVSANFAGMAFYNLLHP